MSELMPSGPAAPGTAREQARQARETAWKTYDTILRAMPDREPRRVWREQLRAAYKAHKAAIRAYDKAVEQEQQ